VHLKLYKYFVSYVWKQGIDWGYGNAEIASQNKIEGIKDLDKIERSIEKDRNLAERTIVILNYIEL